MASLLDPSILFIDEIEPGDLLYVVRPGAPAGERARKIGGADLLQQLQSAAVVPAGSSGERPPSPGAGTLYFDTGVGALIVYTGSAWVRADGGAL